MAELKKVENNIFKEYYEGRNDGRRVICILDLNCVRYMVFAPGKWGERQISRREFANGKESLCFKNATKALNK